MKKIFLNERLMMAVIIANSAILFAQQCGATAGWLQVADVVCTVVFIIEMVTKHVAFGIRGYWKNAWNVMDGVLVVLSIPSVVAMLLPVSMTDLSFFLVLRILRVLRFFRLVHVFPGFGQIMKNFGLALRQSWGVMLSILVMIVTFAMVSCSLFGEAVPDYFGTPLSSIYSTFRIFTGEGWNEIPDTLASVVGVGAAVGVKIYFCLMLVLGCIIGMSLLNSIFVDAMVSDNNDEVKEQLTRLEEKIDRLSKRLED